VALAYSGGLSVRRSPRIQSHELLVLLGPARLCVCSGSICAAASGPTTTIVRWSTSHGQTWLSARLSPVPPANGTCTTLVYRRRRRERAVLYRLVQQLLESWLAARREADPDGVPIPRHFERELRGYLAAVLIEAADRSGLERLLRYCACPAFASERLSWDGSDQPVRYRLTKPPPTGQTELALTRLELLDRLAALMTLPRGHCHHYAGQFVCIQVSNWNTDRVDEIRA